MLLDRESAAQLDGDLFPSRWLDLGATPAPWPWTTVTAVLHMNVWAGSVDTSSGGACTLIAACWEGKQGACMLNPSMRTVQHAAILSTYDELLSLWTVHSMGQVGMLQLTFHPAAALVPGACIQTCCSLECGQLWRMLSYGA